jgi:predicted CXXCH cytochrome family protein
LSGRERSTASAGREYGRFGPRSACAIVLLLAVIWLGCSVEKHYKLLSFFFDGVPDPALVAAGRTELERVRAAGGTIYAHEPYAQERCDECHRDSRGSMLIKVPPTVCGNCHTGVGEQHRFVHGPVAAGACLWCHAPHESTTKSLLRASAVQLCSQCHSQTLGTQRSTIPEHSDPERNCLDCHYGHGGSDRFFLTYPRK